MIEKFCQEMSKRLTQQREKYQDEETKSTKNIDVN